MNVQHTSHQTPATLPVSYVHYLSRDSYSLRIPVLKSGDVLKVDFGVHVKGRILDSAFTMTWEPTYDKLLEAVKAATDTGVRVSSFTLQNGLSNP